MNKELELKEKYMEKEYELRRQLLVNQNESVFTMMNALMAGSGHHRGDPVQMASLLSC